MADTNDSREKQREHVRRYRAANREKLNEKARERDRARRLAMGPEVYNAIARAWRASNRDKVNMRRKAAYAADPAKYIAKNREGARKSAAKWRAENPSKSAYTKHKGHAKQRGIPFLLSFAEWWDIWNTSGKWSERGQSTGQYVMARLGDAGPYATGNVRIITCNENVAEWHQNGRPRRHD